MKRTRYPMAFDDEFTPYRPQPAPRYPVRQSPRSALSPWITPLLSVLAVCALVFLGMMLWREYKAHVASDERNIYGTPRPVDPRGDLSDSEKSNIAIYKQTKPSVVHITSMTIERDEWSLNSQEVPEGTGSGFIWDKGGHVITNYHVIKNA